MAAKEAKARIKINRMLEEAGWRFFDDASGKANIVLEPNNSNPLPVIKLAVFLAHQQIKEQSSCPYSPSISPKPATDSLKSKPKH